MPSLNSSTQVITDNFSSLFKVVFNINIVHNYYAFFSNPFIWLQQIHKPFFKNNSSLLLNILACNQSANNLTTRSLEQEQLVTPTIKVTPQFVQSDHNWIEPFVVSTDYKRTALNYYDHSKFSSNSALNLNLQTTAQFLDNLFIHNTNTINTINTDSNISKYEYDYHYSYLHNFNFWANNFATYTYKVDASLGVVTLQPLLSYNYTIKPSYKDLGEVGCRMGYLSNHGGFSIERSVIFSLINANYYIPEFHIYPCYVFGKRFDTEFNLSAIPSRFAQFQLSQLAQLDVINFRTYTIHFNLENPYIHVYLRNAFDGYSDFVDLVLSHLKPEQYPTKFANYIMHPTYIRELMLRYGFPTLDQLKNIFNEYQERRVKSIDQRPYFCGQVSNHDKLNNWVGVRYPIVHAINEVIAPLGQTVFCGGRFNNNTNMLKEECNDDKCLFLKKFIFNVCPENSWTPGYVTEKIFDCYEGGSIPIYWGSLDHDLDIFNLDAIVYFNPRKVDVFKQRIHQLFTDNQALQALMDQPIFKPGAAEVFFCRYLAPLYNQLELLTGQNLNALRKGFELVSRDYCWQDDYLRAKATLVELGHNPVDIQDHLLDNPRYQWPFLKADRIRVACDYRPLHQQFPKASQKPILPLHQTIKAKPLFDSVASNVQALDHDRKERAVLSTRTHRYLLLRKNTELRSLGVSSFNIDCNLTSSLISSPFGDYEVLNAKSGQCVETNWLEQVNYQLLTETGNLDLAQYLTLAQSLQPYTNLTPLAQIPIYLDYHPELSQVYFSNNYVNQTIDYSLEALNLIFCLKFNQSYLPTDQLSLTTTLTPTQKLEPTPQLKLQDINVSSHTVHSNHTIDSNHLLESQGDVATSKFKFTGTSVKDQLRASKSHFTKHTQLSSIPLTSLSLGKNKDYYGDLSQHLSQLTILKTGIKETITNISDTTASLDSTRAVNTTTVTVNTVTRLTPSNWHQQYLLQAQQQQQAIQDLTADQIKVQDFCVNETYHYHNSPYSSQTHLAAEFITNYLTPPKLSATEQFNYALTTLEELYRQDELTLRKRAVLKTYVQVGFVEHDMDKAISQYQQAQEELTELAQLPFKKFVAKIEQDKVQQAQYRQEHNLESPHMADLNWQNFYAGLLNCNGILFKSSLGFSNISTLPRVSYSYTNFNQRYMLTKLEQAQGLGWQQRKQVGLTKAKNTYYQTL